MHFAVSSDGYNFEPLNNNDSVIKQTLGKKCCRDPFIFRDENNVFHIIATDMRSNDGWNSNNSMVVWDSEDLINWKNGCNNIIRKNRKLSEGKYMIKNIVFDMGNVLTGYSLAEIIRKATDSDEEYESKRPWN